MEDAQKLHLSLLYLDKIEQFYAYLLEEKCWIGPFPVKEFEGALR